MNRLFIINPGSTSTKIAIYNDLQCVSVVNLSHPDRPDNQEDDFVYRIKHIKALFGLNPDFAPPFDAIVGRGGLLLPLQSGVYAINDIMRDHLRKGISGRHASNLGGLLAHEIAAESNHCPAFIVNPVVVDELTPSARVAGHPLFIRKSIFHALNHKSVAMRYARETGLKYEKMNLIVAHLGGGITVAAHKKGRIVDVNNGMNGYGPLSPERAGTLGAGELVSLCFSGKYTQKEIQNMLIGRGGINAYTGLSNMQLVEEKAVAGDKQCTILLEAMVQSIARNIGAMACGIGEHPDAIILTGGIAHSAYITGRIIKSVGFLAPVKIYPGEDEMYALAEGAFSVLNGTEMAKNYPEV